ncbi:MAG: PEP-CTERM sorting domain-containing protein [Verrucomicrobiota bacterium]
MSLPTKLMALAFASALFFPAIALAVVDTGSQSGNPFLHAIGWQTFDNAGANNNSGISDNTPESNSTFDSSPVGGHAVVGGGGVYLTGIIGSGASVLGRQGFGQNTNNGFLNGDTFGQTPGGNQGLFIEDVPNAADGSLPGTRVGPFGGAGTSSWKFRTNGNQEFGDFSITNHSDFEFRLERLHYDARVGNDNSPQDLDLIYLAGGSSNLIRVSTGTEVPDLHVISDRDFSGTAGSSTQNVTASLAASFVQSTAVRLGPGQTASFRFRWTGSATDFAEAQIDNLAVSGTFQDQNNGFASIDPVAFTQIPEPSRAMLILVGLIAAGLRRRRV